MRRGSAKKKDQLTPAVHLAVSARAHFFVKSIGLYFAAMLADVGHVNVGAPISHDVVLPLLIISAKLILTFTPLGFKLLASVARVSVPAPL